jgi:hypothetical protein
MRAIAIAAVTAAALLGADAADMSGHWVLNVKASKWGQRKAPQNVTVDIQHQEPKLKYHGELTPSLEGQPISFSFDGAIDEKEYRVKEDNLERKVVLKREGRNRIRSTTSTDDGKTVQTAVTTISPDGRRMTRDLTLKSPEGTLRWTEVYEKQ